VLAGVTVLLASCGLVSEVRDGPEASSSTTSVTIASATPTPTPTPEFADMVERVGRGTVRIEVSTCDNNRSMGSGFVVGDNLVMTAAHVVDQAGSLSLQVDGVVSTARVIDFDYDADVALLRSEDSLTGRALELAAEKPRLGTELAVLGFPDWVQDLRVTKGVVSSLEHPLSYADFTVEKPVMVTDAAINGGNSGGPVVDRMGVVIGLVTGKEMLLSDLTTSEGTAYVVPSTELDDRLDLWRSREGGAGPCSEAPDEGEPAPILEASYSSPHPDAADITQMLALHGESINRGEYEAAYSLFTDSMKKRQGSAGDWSSGLNTSYWRTLTVDDVTRVGEVATVQVRFRTEQDAEFGPKGATCSDWSQTRTMLLVDEVWLIDQVKNKAGSPSAC